MPSWIEDLTFERAAGEDDPGTARAEAEEPPAERADDVPHEDE